MLELVLVEHVGEEGVCGVVGRKPLLEQEQVIHVVEDAMEIRGQKRAGHKTAVLHQIGLRLLSNHRLVALDVHLLDFWSGNATQLSLLNTSAVVKELPDFSYLKQQSNVWVYAFLLEQIVVSLLEILELNLILRELGQEEHESSGHVELDSTAVRLKIALEDHVHENLELVGSLFVADSLVLSRHYNEGVLLLIASLHRNPPLVETVSVDEGIEPLNVYCFLWKWFLLINKVLARNLYEPAVVLSQERTQVFQVHRVLTLVYVRDQIVSQVPQSQKSPWDALFSGFRIYKISVPARRNGFKNR